MASANSKAKTTKGKSKAEARKWLDEIKALAIRQGYVTEDQVMFLLDEDLDPELQVEQMDEIHGMLSGLGYRPYAIGSDSLLPVDGLQAFLDNSATDYVFSIESGWEHWSC